MNPAETSPTDGAIPALVRAEIVAALEKIERDRDVVVLYACESGSRAWGFASRDSDFDGRFVYVHRPSWYLSIEDRRDVIELPISGDLDVAGWELRKALRLFRKSNPPLLEWLRSPIVYRERGVLAPRLRSLVERYFAPRACLHHYLHMAKGNVREYFSGPEVRLKKYLYVLRPLIACLWIIRTNTMAPMEFEPTVAAEVADPAVREAIAALLARKRAGDELDKGPPIAALDAFIAETTAIVEAEATRVPSPEMAPAAELDTLVREVLLETWGAL